MSAIPADTLEKLLKECRVGCGVDKDDDALDDQLQGPLKTAIAFVMPTSADATTYFDNGAAIGAVVELVRTLWDQNATGKDFSPVFIGLRKKAKLMNGEG